MSRNYEAQVEVFPCAETDLAVTRDTLTAWGLTIVCDTAWLDDERGDGWSFWGGIQLTNGETEEQKHEALRAKLPACFVTTRWRWVDDQPWDEHFLSDPLRRAHPPVHDPLDGLAR